jgi:hypothetical protein
MKSGECKTDEFIIEKFDGYRVMATDGCPSGLGLELYEIEKGKSIKLLGLRYKFAQEIHVDSTEPLALLRAFRLAELERRPCLILSVRLSDVRALGKLARRRAELDESDAMEIYCGSTGLRSSLPLHLIDCEFSVVLRV